MQHSMQEGEHTAGSLNINHSNKMLSKEWALEKHETKKTEQKKKKKEPDAAVLMCSSDVP